jgi:hypothetical protein
MATKDEWFSILDQEEGQKLSIAIIEEIVSKSQNVIFQRKIQTQLIPYTLNYIKNTILGVVEVMMFHFLKMKLRFLAPDKEASDPKTWEPDMGTPQSLIIRT